MTRSHLLAAILVALAVPAFAQAPAPQPKAPASAAVPAHSPYEKPAREFVMNFVNGRFDTATKDFNDSMKLTVQAGTLKSMKEQVDAAVGAFRAIKDVIPTADNGLVTIEFIVAYEKSDVSFKVQFDRYNRIGAVYFDPIVPEKIDPALERTARELLAAINAGRFEAVGKHFDKRMKDDLPPAKLAALATQMQQTFGRFRAVTEVHEKNEPAHITVELIADYDKAQARVSVVFDPRKTFITGLYIAPAKPVR